MSFYPIPWNMTITTPQKSNRKNDPLGKPSPPFYTPTNLNFPNARPFTLRENGLPQSIVADFSTGFGIPTIFPSVHELVGRIGTPSEYCLIDSAYVATAGTPACVRLIARLFSCESRVLWSANRAFFGVRISRFLEYESRAFF